MYILLRFGTHFVQGISCTFFLYFFRQSVKCAINLHMNMNMKMYSVAELSELAEHITPNAQVRIALILGIGGEVAANLQHGLRYVKNSLMSWVVVIPKKGWRVWSRPPFFWYDTDRLFRFILLIFFCYSFFFFLEKSLAMPAHTSFGMTMT